MSDVVISTEYPSVITITREDGSIHQVAGQNHVKLSLVYSAAHHGEVLAIGCQYETFPTSTRAHKAMGRLVKLLMDYTECGRSDLFAVGLHQAIREYEILPIHCRALGYIWNETEFEWYIPTEDVVPVANDIMPTIERRFLATMIVISHDILNKGDEDTIQVMEGFCAYYEPLLQQLQTHKG